MNLPPSFAIAGRQIGPTEPPYIIAEVSANHCQNLDTAKRILIDCAAAGVDAVKLQTYSPDTITLDVDLPPYVIGGGTWSGERLYDLYRRAMTPWEWTSELMRLAAEHGVHLFSTPFDPTAVDYLESCQVPAYKVASFELTYHQLLQRIGATGKPVIMSTGLSSFDEISAAVQVLVDSGAPSVALLKCTSAYPASIADLNLTLIPRMERDFRMPIGYSDHTIGTTAAVAAVALGACIVEKHVKDASSTGSADESFSTLPDGLTRLVTDCHDAWAARGRADYGPTESERPSVHFRRSIVASHDLPAGHRLTIDDLAIVRPNIGAQPRELGALIGTLTTRSYRRGEGITAPMADPRLVIRPLAPTDAGALLAWRNDPTAYRWFRDARPLSPAEHERWMSARLADAQETTWVAELAGAPVGRVRLEDGGEDGAEVSIVVDSSARGSGVGSALLDHCTAQARLRSLGSIRAEVHTANDASIRLFTSHGFQAVGWADDFMVLRLA